MEEKQLEILFRKFLFSKGYKNGNLLSQIPLRTTGEGVFRPDLVVLDIDNKEYVAIIEFKSNIDDRTKVNTIGQFYKYFSLLGTQVIPSFLVFAVAENEFQILSLTEKNTFEPISKEEFPSLETLSAKRMTEEKLIEREFELEKLKELEIKKLRSRQFSLLSILSLVIGAIASFVTIFYQQNEFKETSNIKSECCDTLQIELTKINSKIKYIEKGIEKSNVTTQYIDTGYSSAKLLALDARIKTIEKGISDNPEKTLSVLQVRNEMEQLKKSVDYLNELNQVKITSLNEKINLVNSFLFGLLITIFGAILSYAFTNLRINRPSNKAGQA